MTISASNTIDVQDTTLVNGQRAIMISTATGNVVIPVGVGSFVAGGKVFIEAQKTVTDNSSTAMELNVADNTRYEFGTLTSLTIDGVPQSGLSSVITFTAGAGFSLSLPVSVATIGEILAGNEPFIEGKRYVISCCNNEAIAYTFNEVSA